METIFLTLLQQLNGALFILVLVAIVCFWCVWKLSAVVTLFHGFTEERKETKEDLRQIRIDISKIEGTVHLLSTKYLSTIQSQSPLNLSEKGQEISRELQSEETIASHWESIRKQIEEKAPLNPYDIQTVSLDVARDCFETIFSEAEREKIKSYAFNKGMDLLEIFPILGIQIRNLYLKEKNIRGEDMDSPAPGV